MKYTSMGVLLVLTLSIVGCASPQLKNTQHLAEEARKQALATTISPEQAFEEAEELLKQAKREELELYAPLHMKAAEQALSEALGFIKSKTNKGKVLEASFKTKKIVFDGLKNKALVQRKLKRSVEQFIRIKGIGGADFFSSEYKSNKQAMTDLVSLLESGEVEAAVKEEQDMLAKLTRLEIKTVYEKYVGIAESVLDKAKSEKADEFAAVTYKKAKKKISQAGDFIKTNYTKLDEVQKVANTAIREANHAYHIGREVIQLEGMKPAPAEKRVLYIESLFETISSSLKLESGIGHSLAEQAKVIAEKAGNKSESIGQMNKLLQSNKDKINAAAEKTDKQTLAKNEEIQALRKENDSLKVQLEETKEVLAAADEELAKKQAVKKAEAADDTKAKTETKPVDLTKNQRTQDEPTILKIENKADKEIVGEVTVITTQQ